MRTKAGYNPVQNSCLRKVIFFLILCFSGIIVSCAKPHQISATKQLNSKISLWNFDETTNLEEAEKQPSEWEIKFKKESHSTFSMLTAENIEFQTVEYSQASFYFNASGILYRIRCSVSGEQNCRKLLSQYKFKYKQTHDAGSKPQESVFYGSNNSRAVITEHPSEAYCILQIEFKE